MPQIKIFPIETMKEKNFSMKNFFLIVILLILISGCKGKSDASKKLEDIRTGTQGIVVSFLPNAPPDKLQVEQNPDADNTFDIVLDLRNKGAYPQPEDRIPAPDGAVYLSGYDPKIIQIQGGVQNWQDFRTKALEGKSTINPNGGLDLITFRGWVDANNLMVEKYEPTFLATACYPYKTVAGPSVCIDPIPYSTVNQKKVCQVQGIALSSQGAPIAVTKIDEEAYTGKTRFKIAIKNVGNGDVFKQDTQNYKCTILGRDDIDKVFVEGVLVGKDKLDKCGPFIDNTVATTGENGYIRLINGEGFIICELPKQKYQESNTAFTTPMTIKLSYYYRNTAEKKIQIKKEITSSGEGGSQGAKESDYGPDYGNLI